MMAALFRETAVAPFSRQLHPCLSCALRGRRALFSLNIRIERTMHHYLTRDAVFSTE
jgi:hypothetical protein